MNVKNNLDEIIKTKKSSNKLNTNLWKAIESKYGEIPDIIKIILEFNGFNSFLALKGIRYDSINEFFSSLESTIDEIINLQDETDEKRMLEKVLPSNQKQFKLKPGYKNLIMNLMLEIDKIDVDEFFNKGHSGNKYDISKLNSTDSLTLKTCNARIYEDNEYQQTEFLKDEEYIVEEYIEDKTDLSEHSYIFKVNSEDSEETNDFLLDSSMHKKKSTQKRKPDKMYNEEFLAQCINPRKRRVSSLKAYSNNDEGICERFSDLIKQSMKCILSQSQLNKLKDVSVKITKETDTCYVVICPLCSTKIKLSVVFENNGRYRNYKRSNFERHLRFKHCKEDESSSKIFTSIKIS